MYTREDHARQYLLGALDASPEDLEQRGVVGVGGRHQVQELLLQARVTRQEALHLLQFQSHRERRERWVSICSVRHY
jgi:hypothetical protein